ncbi:TPA: hypothetical protein ACH3X1_016799 [Trebouxia sp. C0004]
MPAMTSKRGSPKDRGRIEGWDQCPLGYTYPDENETIAIIDGALESLITDLKKPLKRKGTGGEPFTIWREDLKVTARNPLVLTRVAKRKVGMPMTLWYGCFMISGVKVCLQPRTLLNIRNNV